MALSGGGIWIPNTPTLRRKRASDDPDSVVRYLRAITAGDVPDARLTAYVEHGPALMELLESSSRHLRLCRRMYSRQLSRHLQQRLRVFSRHLQ